MTFLKKELLRVPSRSLSPLLILALGIGFWVAVRLGSSFVWYTSALEESALFFIASFLVCFGLGLWLAQRSKPAAPAGSGRFFLDPATPAGLKAIRITAIVLALLCILFVSLRIVDLIVNRGLLEFANAQAARMADNTVIEGRTTGGLGLISGLGYPIAIPMIVMAALFHKHLTKWQLTLSIGSFCYYGFFVLLSGSRYILIGPLFVVLIAYIIGAGSLRVTRGRLLGVVAAGLLGFGLITAGTRARDQLFGTESAEETLIVMPYRLQYGTEKPFELWFADQPEPVQEALLGWISFAWYVNHGLFEFQTLLDHYDPNQMSYGAAQFSRAFYFFRVVGLSDIDDSAWINQLKNNGFYTSFFGPVVMDFGYWGGCVFMVILGWLFQASWTQALRGNIFALMFYPYFASVIFSFTTNNLIMAGLGVPIMANIFLSCLIAVGIQLRLKRRPAGLPLPSVQS